MDLNVGLLRKVGSQRVAKAIENIPLDILFGKDLVDLADDDVLAMMNKVHTEILARIQQ